MLVRREMMGKWEVDGDAMVKEESLGILAS